MNLIDKYKNQTSNRIFKVGQLVVYTKEAAARLSIKERVDSLYTIIDADESGDERWVYILHVNSFDRFLRIEGRKNLRPATLAEIRERRRML